MEAIDLNLTGPAAPLSKSDKEVELPEDVKQAFQQAGVWPHFEEMSYYKKKEFRDWISWAKTGGNPSKTNPDGRLSIYREKKVGAIAIVRKNKE